MSAEYAFGYLCDELKNWVDESWCLDDAKQNISYLNSGQNDIARSR